MSAPTPPPSAYLQSVGGTAWSDVWAVGAQSSNSATLAEHFDGTAWSIVATPNLVNGINLLSGVSASTSSDAWAVGQAAISRNPPQPLAEHWDGTLWSIVPITRPAIGYFTAVAAIARNDVWAVGEQCANQLCKPLAEHFNGTRWFSRYLPSHGALPLLQSVSADASNDVWAVGSTYVKRGNGYVSEPLTEHWNGSTWSDVRAAPPGGNSRFAAVRANAPTDVWAVGSHIFQGPTLRYHVVIEHWNGSLWSIVPNPADKGAESNAYGLSGTGPNDMWVVGSSQVGGSLLTEHWDGSTWSSVYAPLSGTFTSSVDFGPNNVIAVGGAGQEPIIENYCQPTGNGDPRFISYKLPPVNGQGADPRQVAVAPDKSVWFTDLSNNLVGHIARGHLSEYTLPTSSALPFGIALGSDGNMWVAEQQGGHIARVTATGTITEFNIPINAGPQSIVSGADGALWFNEGGATLGRITTGGLYSEYKIPIVAYRLAASADGTIWFDSFGSNQVGQFNIPAQQTKIYTLPTQSVAPEGIAVTADGSAWVAEYNTGIIDHILLNGSVSQYPEPNLEGAPFGLTVGGDGKVWFTNLQGGQVGSIAGDGSYTIYIPPQRNGATGIAGAPGDNSIWLADTSLHKIVRLGDIR